MSTFGVLEFRSASVYPDIMCTHGFMDTEIQFINRVRRRKICALGEENIVPPPTYPQRPSFCDFRICMLRDDASKPPHCSNFASTSLKNSINMSPSPPQSIRLGLVSWVISQLADP
jgi:hypothetical protein